MSRAHTRACSTSGAESLSPSWGYRSVGAARAIETLKGIAVSLSMAPIKAGVNITMEPFMEVWKQRKTFDDYEYLRVSRAQMLDELIWWANTLKKGREA